MSHPSSLYYSAQLGGALLGEILECLEGFRLDHYDQPLPLLLSTDRQVTMELRGQRQNVWAPGESPIVVDYVM